MRILRTEKRIKEVIQTVEDYNICDKCNNKIKTEDNWDAFECGFILKTGSKYPEGGSGDKQEMELCKECVDEFIMLLKTNGYRINESEWDY